jgi:hypothetical protein
MHFGWNAAAALHADFDSINLRRFDANKVGQPGCELPELGRHRAVVGVDKKLPRFEIRHAGAAGEIGWQIGGEYRLQPDQPGSMGRQPRHAGIGKQAVFEGTDGAAWPH